MNCKKQTKSKISKIIEQKSWLSKAQKKEIKIVRKNTVKLTRWSEAYTD